MLGLIENRDDAGESPARSIYENIATREEVIKMFDKLLRNSFH